LFNDSLIQSTGEMYEVELFTLCHSRPDRCDTGAARRARKRSGQRRQMRTESGHAKVCGQMRRKVRCKVEVRGQV
jgi:hypothetical protein